MLILLCTAMPCIAVAADLPTLKSISFDNAEIDGDFSPDVHEYTLTLEDDSRAPAISDYEIDGDAELFINNIYGFANNPIGISAQLRYENGSSIYKFTYNITNDIEINSDNTLTDIYCPYCELDSEVTQGDTSYKLYIPKDLTVLSITPVTHDVNAYCPPVELTLTQAQEPDILLICTATDGSQCEYKLKIQRVNKTLEQVKAEMSDDSYETFVNGTHFYQQKQFIVVSAASVCAIILMLILFRLLRRITINPYDSDEKPFYRPKQ